MQRIPRLLAVLLLVLCLSSTGCDVDVDLDEDLEIVTDTLPAGRLRVPYFAEIETDGDADVFRLVSGNLPPGLSLSDDGEISGDLTTAGTFVFTIEVLDIFGDFIDDSVSKGFAIVIRA